MKFIKYGRPDRGFTLIEIVAVLAVMALLAAVTWPRVAALSGWKLETAAENLAGDLRLIRQEAITSGKACKISFFVENDNYQVKLADRSYLVFLPEGVSFEGTTTFQGNPRFVHYTFLGRPSGGGTAILKSDRGEKRYIIVKPVTGRIRISKIPPAHW